MSIPTEDEVFFAAKIRLHQRVEVLKYYAKYLYLMKLKDSTLGVRPAYEDYKRSLVVYSPEEIYLHRNTNYINRELVKQTLEARDWKKAHPSYSRITWAMVIIASLSFLFAFLTMSPKMQWFPTSIPLALGIPSLITVFIRSGTMNSKNGYDESIYTLDELLRLENTDVAWMEIQQANVIHLIKMMKTALKTNASEYYPQIEAEEPRI